MPARAWSAPSPSGETGRLAWVGLVIQLLGVAAKAHRPELLAIGVTAGLLAGFAADAIVTAAGA